MRKIIVIVLLLLVEFIAGLFAVIPDPPSSPYVSAVTFALPLLVGCIGAFLVGVSPMQRRSYTQTGHEPPSPGIQRSDAQAGTSGLQENDTQTRSTSSHEKQSPMGRKRLRLTLPLLFLLAVLLLILLGLILLQVLLLRMFRGTLNALQFEPITLLYLISFFIILALVAVISGYRFYRRRKQLFPHDR
jgi:cation transport ATPase